MNILLLGAGFTRNWGGWLAEELTGDILARLEEHPELAARLRRTNAFESLLAELQLERSGGSQQEANFLNFENAVVASFKEMNSVIQSGQFRFEFSNSIEFQVAYFLARFDVIYTLNQDLLLETHYQIPGEQRKSKVFPGITRVTESVGGRDISYFQPTSPVNLDFGNQSQPIFKLHGSMNWRRSDGKSLLVMGGNKGEAIRKEPLLQRYHEKFRSDMAAGNTRLMVIGYSFQDDHINKALIDAAGNGLKLYIVDLAGEDNLNPKKPGVLIPPARNDLQSLPLIGLSRRPLSSTFSGSDRLEHAKLLRFFKDIPL